MRGKTKPNGSFQALFGITPSSEPVSTMIMSKKSLMSQVLRRERAKRASNDALFLHVASNVISD
jgi:hypothetical protein